MAIKAISLHDKDYSEAATVEHEIHLMRMSVHNYVVRMLDSFRSPTEYKLVLEWESGGTLRRYLG